MKGINVEVTVPEGAMWEQPEWTIRYNALISQYDGSAPCRHCGRPFIVHTPKTPYRNETTERQWICPSVVVVTNGCVCLNCILAATLTWRAPTHTLAATLTCAQPERVPRPRRKT
jgi:hypothetical protein